MVHALASSLVEEASLWGKGFQMPWYSRAQGRFIKRLTPRGGVGRTLRTSMHSLNHTNQRLTFRVEACAIRSFLVNT